MKVLFFVIGFAAVMFLVSRGSNSIAETQSFNNYVNGNSMINGSGNYMGNASDDYLMNADEARSLSDNNFNAMRPDETPVNPLLNVAF